MHERAWGVRHIQDYAEPKRTSRHSLTRQPCVLKVRVRPGGIAASGGDYLLAHEAFQKRAPVVITDFYVHRRAYDGGRQSAPRLISGREKRRLLVAQ